MGIVAPPSARESIRTPDQRLRIFVSSSLAELAEERRAVRSAVEALHLTPVLFEQGARAHPPRALYRAYLDQSQVFVGIYWQRYGWVAPEMTISGLEDEYRLSRGKPRLVYVKHPAPERESRLAELLKELKQEDAISYKPFSSASELEMLVADDLAVLVSERFEARATSPALRAAAAPVPTTSLVGREGDLARLSAALRDPGLRLLTLTGTGGIGKTRLAIAAMSAVGQRWADGSFFVDLSAVTERGQVMPTIALALGLKLEGREPPVVALAGRLDGLRCLLVLDNFEQVAEAAADLASLLQLCPGLTLLVTSRVPLHIRGEREWPVAPLPVGPGESAIQLLVARARDVRPGFSLTAENAAAVEALCRRLDGLPLALELAAAQLRVLPPEKLLSRMTTCLDLAGGYADLPERQRTLRAALDHTHRLLPAAAQTLFARLAVFAGGFTLECAEQVCGWDGVDVVQALSSLLDYSLVVADQRSGTEPRFRMLETVRAYALERLGTGPDADEVWRRLVGWLTRYFEHATGRLHGADQQRAMAQLDAEVENHWGVWRWALRHREVASFAEGCDTWFYWWWRGWLPEMHRRLQPLLTPDVLKTVPERAQASLLLAMAGALIFGKGRYEEALPYLESCAEICQRVNRPRELASARLWLGMCRPYDPKGPARSELEASAAYFRERGDRVGLAYVISHLGDYYLLEGDVARATAGHLEMRQIGEASGDRYLLAQADLHLALDALQRGDVAEARACVARAAAPALEMDYAEGIAYVLMEMAAVAASSGSTDVAATLIGAAEAVRAPPGLKPWPLLVPFETSLCERVRSALGDEGFGRKVAEGRALAFSAAWRLGLSVVAPPPPVEHLVQAARGTEHPRPSPAQ